MTTQEPSHPRLRMAGRALIGAAVGIVFLLTKSPRAGRLALGVAGVSMLLAALAPVGWLSGIRRGLDAFGRGVGGVVSAVVLTVVYFGFIVPVGLVTRGRPDARYARRIDRAAPTYWRKHRAGGSSERQF